MKIPLKSVAVAPAMLSIAAMAVACLQPCLQPAEAQIIERHSQPAYAPDSAHTPASEPATSYFGLPIDRLKIAVPALNGIRYESGQKQLPVILASVAKRIAEVLPRLPDLISREDVFHFQSVWDVSGPGGMSSGQPWSREFKYLLRCQRHADGSITIAESRLDAKGQLVNSTGSFTALRGYGFAYQWLFFSAANQPEFRFRYLGQQEKGGRKTFVVAFVQDPRRVDDPAYFMADGKMAPFYYQGIFWVDESTFDIVALRTDLLAPLPKMLLRQLTTELKFHSAAIRGYDAVFWLPSEVDISSDQGLGPSEESHRYSDYHLFHAVARIVSTP